MSFREPTSENVRLFLAVALLLILAVVWLMQAYCPVAAPDIPPFPR